MGHGFIAILSQNSIYELVDLRRASDIFRLAGTCDFFYFVSGDLDRFARSEFGSCEHFRQF